MLKELIDLIYPRRCPICGNIVVPKNNKVCVSCDESLKYIVEPRCKKCSKPLINQEQEYCFDCNRKQYHYTKGFALWVYDKNMQKSIAAFKYHNKREYADFYIEELLKNYTQEIVNLSADALIPIPLHPSKKKYRGYNQAEIIAKGISKQLSIPILKKTLCRNKKTLPQKGLDDKQRLKNLENAFYFTDEEACQSGISYGKVILVDDIYTTGSTIEACTNVLLQHGVKEVYFISICIGKGF